MLRRAPRPPGPRGRARARAQSSAGVVAVVASAIVLLGVPVLVVLLASDDTAQTSAAQERVVPGSSDPRRPSAPFFANAGDGVRPDGVGCSTASPSALRGLAHLDVFADGARVIVPGRIGVSASCAYWLHTEAPDGVIVIGSPERRSFTLGDFFDVWGAPLSRRRVLSFGLDAGRRLGVFVDGRRVAGDPRAVRLVDGREIALVIGRPPSSVPARFAFPRPR